MSNSFRSQTQRINVPVQTSQSGINVNIGGYSGTYTRARYDTTESWNSNPEFVPKRGEIIVYSDYDSYIDDQGETHYIPGIKVGDGNTLLTDLPFANAGQSSGGTGEIVPVFSVGAGGFSCDMTFEEVLNAINEKKCNGCRVNLVEYLLNANLLTLTNSQIVFCATTVGAMFNHDAEQEGVVFTLYILFNSDNTASIDLGNVDIANVLATPYSELSFPITKGTVCYKGNRLYKANQDIATQEDWTNAHWDQTTVEAELNLQNDSIANKADKDNPTFTGSISCGRKENTTVGDSSIAFGDEAVASDEYAVSIGAENEATGWASFAEGCYNVASGDMGVALGDSNVASGTGSFVSGISNEANGDYSHADCYGNIANGQGQHITGAFNIASTGFPTWTANTHYNVGDRVIRSGYGYKCKTENTDASFDFSKWEKFFFTAKELFIVGNGSGFNNRSNAYSLDVDGNGHFAGDVYVQCNPDGSGGTKLAIDGKADKSDTVLDTTLSRGRKANTTVGTGSFAFGNNVEASGTNSFAEGSGTIASGNQAHASGTGTTASGMNSSAGGINSSASGQCAQADGMISDASGTCSNAKGMYAKANGSAMTAIGRANVAATLYPEFVAGSYDVGDKVSSFGFGYECLVAGTYSYPDNTNWKLLPSNGDLLFAIGNGLNDENRSNAMTVDTDGNEELAGGLTINKDTANEISVGEELSRLSGAVKGKADKHTGKNIFNINRTRGVLHGYAPQARDYKDYEYYVGLTVTGYYNESQVRSITVTDSISVLSGGGYGVAFPVRCKPQTKYTISFTNSDSANSARSVSYHDNGGNLISYEGINATGKTITTPQNAYYMLFYFGSTGSATTPVVYSNIQVEEGSAATTYVPYSENNGLNEYIGEPDAGGVLVVGSDGYVDVNKTIPMLTQLEEIENSGIHFPIGVYKIGSLYQGKYKTDEIYNTRVSEVNFLTYPNDIIIQAKDGYRFFVAYYTSADENTFTHDSGWGSKHSVSKNTLFRIGISRNPEGSEPANITEFRDAISWMASDDPRISTIINRNNDVLLNAQASCKYGVNGLGTENYIKTLSVLVSTDVHGVVVNMQNVLQYFNAMPFIDYGVCLGDITGRYYSDSDGTWYTSIVNAATKPFFTILGNHDGGNGKTASQCATVQQSFDKWIKPTRTEMGLPSLTTPYYAITNSTYKTCLVFLNNYDVPDTTVSGGTDFVVSRGAEVISQTQVNWLLNVLDNIPSDYTLVIFEHSFPYNNAAVECNWTQIGTTSVNGNGVACYTDIIPDIVNAWKNGTSLSKTYTPNISDVTASVSINHSFASRGTGKFACHIVGHMHQDVIAKSVTYPDQLVISLCATACDNWNNVNSDLPRIMGEKSQDAITLVGFDFESNKISLARIGSNITIDMTNRTMIRLNC